jgi:tRNA pseudouridine38-40 synthase
MGTLIDIGRGRITDSMADLLAAKDRSRAGMTAPACGLVLDKVFYEGVD